MKNIFNFKTALLVLSLFCLLAFCVQPVLAWESYSNGVTLYSTENYDSDDWYYGDDIYATNENDFPVFISVHFTQYDNIQFSAGGTIGPNETRKIGWVVCANDQYGWYYNLDWEWEEVARAF